MDSGTVPILSVRNLSIRSADGERMILKDVSFDIRSGEILALVGESGSGKSMTANAIIGLMPPGIKVVQGQLFFQGKDLLQQRGKQRRKLAGQSIGYVFQDYRGSFAPFRTIGSQLMDAIRAHRAFTRKVCKKMVLEHLDKVGLPAERIFSSYSFQLSGGQLQRAALSAVLMLEPELLIADEPTTALDVISGETVLDLMRDIQGQTGCAILLISHDLQMVIKRANCVAVMKEGQIVEQNTASDIGMKAEHPYTLKLLDNCPKMPVKDDAKDDRSTGDAEGQECGKATERLDRELVKHG